MPRSAVTHNINYNYSNSPNNVFPSAYTTNTQLQLTQPLLGSAPLPGQQAGPPAGLEANRAPIVIARLNADAAVWRFKAEVMASVRSIEQQYWSLSQQQVQLWSSETAVALGEEILKREQSELEVGRGTRADVAEAQQRLEQFRLDFVTRTSDVITTERQLRNILGLPPADNRRIVPVTAPTEARMEPDWDASLAQMITFQPDIVQQQLQVRVAELQLLLARNQLLPVLNFNALYQFNGLGDNLDSAEANMTGAALRAIDPLSASQQRAAGVNSQPRDFNNFQQWQVGFTFAMPLGMRAPLANNKQAQYVAPPAAGLPAADRPPDDPLAGPVLPGGRRQLQAVQDGLAAAGRRRRSGSRPRRRSTRKGGSRSTATSTRSPSSPTRSPRRPSSRPPTTSRSSRWRRPRGRCSAYDNIAVAEGPSPRKAYIQARDQQAAHVQLPIPHDGPYHPRPINGPANPDPVVPMPPPDLGPEGPRPLLPAPVGPLGPPPTPLPPQVPAGEPDILSGAKPGPAEPEVVPVSAPGRAAPTRSRPRTCPRCRSRSTCPPCRRSDRDRTPDRASSPGPAPLTEGAGPSHSRGGRPTAIRRDQGAVRVRLAPRVKTLLTLGSALDQNESDLIAPARGDRSIPGLTRGRGSRWKFRTGHAEATGVVS